MYLYLTLSLINFCIWLKNNDLYYNIFVNTYLLYKIFAEIIRAIAEIIRVIFLSQDGTSINPSLFKKYLFLLKLKTNFSLKFELSPIIFGSSLNDVCDYL